ncbi:hypothetical protein OUZ56_018751 [Daphnia magna]|uniref:Uncharacterized protein n=1 Tax=Daphnia magna TaxID=35525 RepID=A0ABQ9Z9N8_9CRUS|nr:hypothetical protein OUZ56_018750 [Daphnia magna]KAK4009617.1 hypothetical protein OUZ56_018751 [Daphnia magna]
MELIGNDCDPRRSFKMFTLSDVLSDWRYFDVAVVRFAEIAFRNPVSRYRRLNVSDRRLFATLLNDAKVTGTSLDFTPFSGEVWEWTSITVRIPATRSIAIFIPTTMLDFCGGLSQVRMFIIRPPDVPTSIQRFCSPRWSFGWQPDWLRWKF